MDTERVTTRCFITALAIVLAEVALNGVTTEILSLGSEIEFDKCKRVNAA
jgi:hypothetical protein